MTSFKCRIEVFVEDVDEKVFVSKKEFCLKVPPDAGSVQAINSFLRFNGKAVQMLSNIVACAFDGFWHKRIMRNGL